MTSQNWQSLSRGSETHLGITAHGQRIHGMPKRDEVLGPTRCGIERITWYRLSENPDFVRRVGLALCHRCFRGERD